MSNIQTYWRAGWEIGKGRRKMDRHRELMERGDRAFRTHVGGWDRPVSAVRRMDAALDFGVVSASSFASDHVETEIARELAGSFGWDVPHTTTQVDSFYRRFVDELGILANREKNEREVATLKVRLTNTTDSIKLWLGGTGFALVTGVFGLIDNLRILNSSSYRPGENIRGMVSLSAIVIAGSVVLAGFAIKSIINFLKQKRAADSLEKEIKAQEAITPTINLTREKLDNATVNNPTEDSLSSTLHLWVSSGILRLHLYERESPWDK
ncbi:hypothetical protein HZC08_01495 [Candidatus Micrarchaeota archaeon]|nr:hypothetical protein [Candidatus Micrarchaeota archaeon]